MPTGTSAFPGIPFEIRRRGARERETLAAMIEAKQLASDPDAKRYDDIDELFNDALK